MLHIFSGLSERMPHLSRIGRYSLHNLNKEHKTSEVGQLKTLRALVHVFSAVVTGITVLAAAAALFIWLLRIAGTEVYIVRSASMEPALSAGDLAVVDRRLCEPEIGDIIAYTLEDNVVAHRVCAASASGFQTRGDANDAADAGIVDRSRVIGTVIGRIGAAGYLLSEIQRIGPAAAALFLMGLNLVSFGLESAAGTVKTACRAEKTGQETDKKQFGKQMTQAAGRG